MELAVYQSDGNHNQKGCGAFCISLPGATWCDPEVFYQPVPNISTLKVGKVVCEVLTEPHQGLYYSVLVFCECVYVVCWQELMLTAATAEEFSPESWYSFGSPCQVLYEVFHTILRSHVDRTICKEMVNLFQVKLEMNELNRVLWICLIHPNNLLMCGISFRATL